MPNPTPTCLVTGANGFLGRHVKAALERRGWRVIELVRNPQPGGQARPFVLGESLAPDLFQDATALVHCAYDFAPLTWEQIHERNVRGSETLLRAARQAKLKSVVYISSISAFEGCRSLYGRAKLETEAVALSLGATVIRPGLIYGDAPEGMFGKLVRQVEGAKLLPLFGGGRQVQYLVHEADLCGFIERCAAGNVPATKTPVTVANETPWTFRQILEAIAQARGRQLRFLPVPWRLVWLAIKTAETCGGRLSFRSDSLVSLMYQNPRPSFAEQQQLQVACRPFAMK
ncbi:MAG: NAD-dependent epimerase/dehydratase family protein [Verrucomicrobiota bacterium]